MQKNFNGCRKIGSKQKNGLLLQARQ